MFCTFTRRIFIPTNRYSIYFPTKHNFKFDDDLINNSSNKYLKLLAETNLKTKIKQLLFHDSSSAEPKKPTFLNVVVVIAAVSLVGVSFYFKNNYICIF
jgi:hypothetical protein